MVEGRTTIGGTWIDRTALFNARQRGEDVTQADSEQAVELKLARLPCWRLLDAESYRARVAEMVDTIERDAIERHRRDQTAPVGAGWVRRRHPHERPKPGHRSPKPRFHAIAKKVREQLVAAYRAFLAAYRIAAARLAGGDTAATFPENCYPPPLPFVEPLRLEPG